MAVTATYTQDIQDATLQLSLSPSSSGDLRFEFTPDTVASFVVQPTNNYAAVFYSPETFAMGRIVMYAAYALAALSLLVFIFGLYKTPFISAELIAVPQLAYLGLSMVKQLPPSLIGL